MKKETTFRVVHFTTISGHFFANYIYIFHKSRIFYLWPLDLVKSNIPVLHSLSSERWQNFDKIPWVYSKKFFFSKLLNKVILATILLILRIWVVLNTSVASMTSTDLITSLASMTSTASLASKNQKQSFLYILSDFPGIWNLSGLNDLYSLNNLGDLNDLILALDYVCTIL